MADVSKINGYNLKDASARAQISTIINGSQPVGKAKEADNATTAKNYDTTTGTLKEKLDKLDNDLTVASGSALEGIATAKAAQQTANEAKSIAQGKSKASVFETKNDMIVALKGAEKDAYNIGDNLLIKETGCPDYWVSAILDTNTGAYGYFDVSELESEKVDLTDYPTKTELTDGTFTVAKAQSALSANEAGTAQTATNAGNVTQQIKGVPISEIFASNGKTVLSAQTAQSAGTATNYDTTTGGIKQKFDSVDSAVGAVRDSLTQTTQIATQAQATANMANAKNIQFSYNDQNEELTISFS